MGVYFAFSDENGCYQQVRSAKFVNRHPYFIRSTLLIKADEWQVLRGEIEKLKLALTSVPADELKWCHLWQLRRAEQRREKIDPNGPLGI
jgi:hypothetical protein